MSRRAKLAVPDWPATDRAAWSRAVAFGDLLESPGPAAHWRPKTQLLGADGYGFWLAWLERHNLLNRSVGPEERLSPMNVLRYITADDDEDRPDLDAGRTRLLERPFIVAVERFERRLQAAPKA